MKVNYPQNGRQLLAAIILKAIDDAKQVANGRTTSFEYGTGLAGPHAEQAFQRLGGRLSPYEDIHTFFHSPQFESWCLYLDLDPEAVRQALTKKGLLRPPQQHEPPPWIDQLSPTQAAIVRLLPATPHQIAQHLYGHASPSTLSTTMAHISMIRKRLRKLNIPYTITKPPFYELKEVPSCQPSNASSSSNVNARSANASSTKTPAAQSPPANTA